MSFIRRVHRELTIATDSDEIVRKSSDLSVNSRQAPASALR